MEAGRSREVCDDGPRSRCRRDGADRPAQPHFRRDKDVPRVFVRVADAPSRTLTCLRRVRLYRPAERVVACYNRHGMAERWIKDGKNALTWTRLSCRRFRNDEVRFQLHALAYSASNVMRTLALRKAVEQRSLTAIGRETKWAAENCFL